jgi:hypothetical protein
MLTDSIFIGGVWVASDIRFSNDVNTMLVSAGLTGTGEEISDDYQLVAGAVGAGTASISVACNPDNTTINGRVVAGVALDGVTQYRNIIPGVVLVFSNTTVNGDTSTVRVGLFAGEVDAFGVGAGAPVAVTRHRVNNPDPNAATGAVATITPEADYVKKIGSVFLAINPYAPGATYKPLGGGSDQVNPYLFHITAVAGAGPTKTVSFTVDGALMAANSIRRVADGSLSNSTGIKAVAGEIYEVVLGNLTGFQFVVDPACALDDTCNILIFPARFMQITGDVGGVADPAGWGTADVPITEVGELVGTITSGGEAFYWSRIVVPPGASSESNPFQMLVSVRAELASPANWGG